MLSLSAFCFEHLNLKIGKYEILFESDDAIYRRLGQSLIVLVSIQSRNISKFSILEFLLLSVGIAHINCGIRSSTQLESILFCAFVCSTSLYTIQQPNGSSIERKNNFTNVRRQLWWRIGVDFRFNQTKSFEFLELYFFLTDKSYMVILYPNIGIIRMHSSNSGNNFEENALTIQEKTNI